MDFGRKPLSTTEMRTANIGFCNFPPTIELPTQDLGKAFLTNGRVRRNPLNDVERRSSLNDNSSPPVKVSILGWGQKPPRNFSVAVFVKPSP